MTGLRDARCFTRLRVLCQDLTGLRCARILTRLKVLSQDNWTERCRMLSPTEVCEMLHSTSASVLTEPPTVRDVSRLHGTTAIWLCQLRTMHRHFVSVQTQRFADLLQAVSHRDRTPSDAAACDVLGTASHVTTGGQTGGSW